MRIYLWKKKIFRKCKFKNNQEKKKLNTKNKSDDITKDNNNIDNISFYSNDDINSLAINDNKTMNNKLI